MGNVRFEPGAPTICNYAGNFSKVLKEEDYQQQVNSVENCSFDQGLEDMAIDYCFGGVVYEILKSSLNQNTDLTFGLGSDGSPRNGWQTYPDSRADIIRLGQRRPPGSFAADRGVKKLGIIFGMNMAAVREKRKMCRTWVANYLNIF